MTRLHVSVRRRVSSAFTLDATFALDFDADRRVAALFGPSGCGKSTTLAVVAGLLAPDEGRIAIDDAVLADTARSVLLPPDARAVGLVAQDGLLFPHLDVRGNLAFAERRAGRRPHPPPGEVADALGLAALLDRRAESLSGGERQRVGLARALLAGPRLLLLDEPGSARDEASRWEVLAYVERVTQRFGVPALYVSHHRAEVLRLAATAARMEHGRVVACGPAADVLAEGAERGAMPNLFRAVYPGAAPTVARIADGVTVQLPDEGADGTSVWCRLSSGAIALERPRAGGATSARNHLPGRIVSLVRDAHRVRVAIDVGVPLHADVTPQAADELGLARGTEVVCTFKVHAIEVLR